MVSQPAGSNEAWHTPDEARLRRRLLQLLSEYGLQPEHDWIEVQAFRYAVRPVRFTYTVTIKRESARAPLAPLLRQATGRGRTDENRVWVLSDAQKSFVLAEPSHSSDEGETK